MYNHLDGLDIVDDGQNIGLDAQVREKREHHLAVSHRQLAHDEGLGKQAANIDRLLRSRQRVFWMRDQHHLGVDQAIEHEASRQPFRIGFDRNPSVQPLFMQFVEDILGRRGEDFQPHAWQIVLEVGEHARNENLRHARPHADRQRIQQRAAQPPGSVGESKQVAHHPL